MKQKTIICNWGSGGNGKSTTIRRIFEKLREQYPNAPIHIFTGNGDIKACIFINGKWIGIDGQGDPKSRLEVEQYKDFLPDPLDGITELSPDAQECSIIICACRSRGQTVSIINGIARRNNFRIIWVTNHRNTSHDFTLQEALNEMSANNVVELIDELLNSAI